MNTMAQAASILDEARIATAALGPGEFPYSLSLPEAYEVQHAGIGLRHGRGESATGLKLGFTSVAKMRQMGVGSVIAGQLTDAMRIPDGGVLRLTDHIAPRVELEIAFRIGVDVDFHASNLDLVHSIEAVAPALEVIDSRFAGFSFDLGKVIADNTSAAAFVVGPWSNWNHQDLSNLAAELNVSGQPPQLSSTAAILGHPLRALAELRTLAREFALPLKAGDIVLAGATTEAVGVTEGVAEGRIAALGRVSLRVQKVVVEGNRL